MAEIVLSIAAKVSEYLVDPAIRGGHYLFCVSKIIKNLENEKVKLTLTRDGVYQRVEEARKKAEKIENAVEKWLHEVQKLLAEVENLELEMKANIYLLGLCPSCRRYHLCKQLAKKTKIMTELNNNSKFERFSRLATLPSIEYFSTGNFTYFESTKLAYNQLLEAMRDDGCYMIGLYGMGGCGKTTLIKEVGKRAKELNLFDKVVFTTVSQTPNVRMIQGEIADLLGLTLGEESEAGRARRLSLRLQSGERILVILDDVWGMLKLEDIGIPLDGNLKGCKVLLTTRLQQLCTLMECQRNVPLLLLSEEEAWIFFQKHARIVDESSSSLLNVAREVAMECKGLPIAIEAVGTSLKGKSLDEWNVALYRLRHSKPVDVEEGVRDAYTCLQLSYDYLKSREAKFLFLMCSMFPEDHEISIEDLFRYGLGLGLCGEVDSFALSRSLVNAGLNHLLDSSLLMHFKTEGRGNHLKMHDMVRDVALWIASKEDRTILVNHAKVLSSLAVDGTIKNCCAVSTWYKGIDQFPQQLDAPKLEMLLLNSNSLLDLSYASFEGMKTLKVMAIIAVQDYISSLMEVSLPQSTQWLTNLQTLRLVGWELGDISFVISLRRLEILDLQGSRFRVLPNGIEKLNKLKLLDLSRCRIDDCCDYVIGRCSKLEELYVYSNNTSFGARIIDSNKCFLENVAFLQLQRYVLQIGQFKEYLSFCKLSMRVLFLGELNISTSNAIIKDLLQRADEVGLDSLHGGCKSIIPELVEVVGSMNQLTRLWLRSCSEIECLICPTPGHAYCYGVDNLFPMLVVLRMENMDNLKQVCCGTPSPCIFQKLELVDIVCCGQLHSIFPRECNLCNLKGLFIYDCAKLTLLFPMSVVRTLLQLEIMTVENCCELKYIMMNEGQNGTNTREEIFPVFGNSKFMFPKLKSLRVTHCDKLEYVLPISLSQGPVQLQHIWLENACELKHVFGKHEELGIPNCQQMEGVFLGEWNLSNLKSLKLASCPKFTSLFSVSVAQTLLLLQELTVENCTNLKYIIFNEEDGTTTREKNFPVSDNSPLLFPKLRNLIVGDCDKLEYVFPISCAQGLVQLQEIQIKNASQIKYVFGKHAGEDLSTNQNEIHIFFPQLKEFLLWNLPGLIKICSGNYQPSWPSLKKLYWENCPKLTIACGNIIAGLDLKLPHSNTEIFAENEEHQNLSSFQKSLPKLQKLVIKGCTKLKIIFSIRMAGIFSQLRSVCI